MRLMQLPGRPECRMAIVILAILNAPTVILTDLYFVGARLGGLPGPGPPPAMEVLLFLFGCLTGQAVLLAFWFSLSRDTLPFRLAVLLAVAAGYNLGVTLLNVHHSALVLSRRSPPGSLDIGWYELCLIFAMNWAQGTALFLALFLMAYALLLPIRRMLRLSLGTPLRDNVPERPQFQIYEWMLWTALVATPLVLIRLAYSESPPPVLLLYGIVFACTLVPLLLGWPVFWAALAQRHPIRWTLAFLILYAAAGWVVSEAAAWIDQASGTTNLTRDPILRFWPLETLLLSAAGILSLNTFVLRGLGFRLVRGS